MPEQTLLRGFPVEANGTYLLLEDVVASIRAYAQAQDDPQVGGAIHELASWFSTAELLTEPRHVTEEPSQTLPEVHGAEADDVTPDVARIEVFPDPPEDPHPKWYARSVDTGGHVLKTSNGSFDQEWVIRNAQERWPGVETVMLKSSGEDSLWLENQTYQGFKGPDGNRGMFPSMGPSPRRLWQGIPEEARDRPHSKLGAPQS